MRQDVGLPKFVLTGWLMWALSALMVPYQFVLQTSPSVMMPWLMQRFQLDVAGVSLLSASFFYCYLILQIPSGMLVDRFGARRLLWIGALLCSGCCWLFLHATTAWQATSARLLMGLATAPAVAAGLSVAAVWLPKKQFAMAAGMTEMIGLFGGAIGELGLAYWIQRQGWDRTWIDCIWVGIVLAMVLCLILRDKPPAVALREQPAPRVAYQLLKQLLREPSIWWNGIYCGLMFGVVSAFGGLWAVPCFRNIFHFPLQSAAFGSALVFAGAACGGPFWGWLSDYCNRRRIPMLCSAYLAVFFATPFIFFANLPVAVVYLLAFGIGYCAGGYVLAFAWMRDMSMPQIRGAAMGFVNMLALFGGLLLQLLMGYMLKWFGTTTLSAGAPVGAEFFQARDYQFILYVLPIACCFAGIIAQYKMKETFCQEVGE